MLFIWNDRLIGLPEIGIASTTSIGGRNSIPELPAGGLAAITQHKRDNLTCFPTECEPDPTLIGFLSHKRPEFIEFECHGGWIGWNGWYERLCQWWQLVGFFLTKQSQYYGQHRMFVRDRVSYCVLDRNAGFLLFARRNRLYCQGFRDFAVHKCDNSTSVCRSGQYRIL
jgi:hypothetical protein